MSKIFNLVVEKKKVRLTPTKNINIIEKDKISSYVKQNLPLVIIICILVFLLISFGIIAIVVTNKYSEVTNKIVYLESLVSSYKNNQDKLLKELDAYGNYDKTYSEQKDSFTDLKKHTDEKYSDYYYYECYKNDLGDTLVVQSDGVIYAEGICGYPNSVYGRYYYISEPNDTIKSFYEKVQMDKYSVEVYHHQGKIYLISSIDATVPDKPKEIYMGVYTVSTGEFKEYTYSLDFDLGMQAATYFVKPRIYEIRDNADAFSETQADYFYINLDVMPYIGGVAIQPEKNPNSVVRNKIAEYPNYLIRSDGKYIDLSPKGVAKIEYIGMKIDLFGDNVVGDLNYIPRRSDNRDYYDYMLYTDINNETHLEYMDGWFD